MTKSNTAKNDDFDPQDFLPYLLNRAAEESSLEFQQLYKDRYGMLRTEWRVLFHLGNYGEMTAKEIGLRARIHKTKVSRAVSKLEQRRYLTRMRDTSDRRVERLTLTPTGRTAYTDLRQAAEAYNAKLAGLFSRDEAALLRKMLRRLAHMD
ncbi:MarR family winged helix-turn-helix transcriptional regulator [Ruegeria atlantica]|uniref:MarR family winged helix-turn-helix transcriptional regulator n=1 Tax=Ruegeria atlantica TaxID=81569 RepID=UPI00147D17C0|nr:MarR family winged helix-turn-helix transcriptional regulator [Ruegeria atlantica]